MLPPLFIVSSSPRLIFLFLLFFFFEVKVFFFVFQVSLPENLFSILDILFVILFREAFISVTLAVGLFIFFFSVFFLEEESFSRYSDVVEIIFLSFLIFEGKMKLSFPLFDSISWKRETLFDVVVFLIFLKGVFLLFPGFSFLLSLPWVLFFSSNDYFLLLSYVSTLFYFFRKRYFFSFLFLFLDFVSSFRHFRKKEVFFLLSFLSIRRFINASKNFQSFFVEKEESGQRRDWNSFRYFNPASNITRLSMLQEFQLLRLKLSGSFKHSEFQPLLRRYRFEELRRKFWLEYYIFLQTFPYAMKFALRMMECSRSRDSIMRLS